MFLFYLYFKLQISTLQIISNKYQKEIISLKTHVDSPPPKKDKKQNKERKTSYTLKVFLLIILSP